MRCQSPGYCQQSGEKHWGAISTCAIQEGGGFAHALFAALGAGVDTAGSQGGGNTAEGEVAFAGRGGS
jgi:hypothetical protein